MPPEEAPPLHEAQQKDQRGTLSAVHGVSPPASLVLEDDLGEAEGPCPNCGARMNAIRGSKRALCPNCGFKDSCCF
jgi:hypothetical protein